MPDVRPINILLAAMLSAATFCAQAISPDRSLKQAMHRVWQAQQGLPRETIYHLAQSGDGYLWLGTRTGLVRFDGIRFVTVNDFGGVSLDGAMIRDLTSGPDGSLWIGTDNDGVVRVLKGKATRLTRQQGLSSNAIRRLLCDSAGRLWVGTALGLACIEDGKIKAFDGQPLIPKGEIAGLCEAPDGKIWIAGEGKTLAVWNGTSFSQVAIEAIPQGTSALDLAVATDGGLWIATANGLISYRLGEGKRYTTRDGLADDAVTCVAAGREGVVWVGTRNGFSRVRNSGSDIDSFRSQDGLSQSTVFAVFEDRDGTVWAGTKHGLNQFLDRRIVPFTVADGLPSNDVGAVYGDPLGNTWVGTLDAGLARYDGRTFSQILGSAGPSPRSARAMTDDGQGGLWVGGDEGIALLKDGRTQRTLGSDQGLPKGSVRCLMRGDDRSLWVGTQTGLAVLRENQIEPATSIRAGVVALGRDAGGQIYAATAGGGVQVRKADGQFQTLRLDGISPACEVGAFWGDEDGALWMGMRGEGLIRVTGDGKISRFGVRDGLFDDDLYAIVPDDHGRLWLGCSKGIFSVNRKDLLQFASGQMKNFASAPFSPTEGQRTIQCKPGVQPAASRMADGRIWFAAIPGIIVVDPANVRPKLGPPNVIIEEVLIDGRAQSPEQLGQIDAGPRNLEFRYTALSFVAPARMTFQYKLDGFDAEWIDAGVRREAFYTNLPPGRYRFTVRATNVDGTPGEAAVSPLLTLAPHIYQRAWFISACAALVVLAAALAYRARVRRIRERMTLVAEERSRIARELHDTLLQGFSGVTMEMQALWGKLPADSSERARLAEIIHDAGDCMVEARRSVTGLRQANAADGTNRGDLASAISEMAKRLTEHSPVRLRLDLRHDGSSLPSQTRYHLLRIAQEALANALRHAQARTIDISLMQVDQVLQLSVSDDGKGFVPHDVGRDDNTEHYGLLGIRERCAQMGGEVQIQSAAGRGTIVRVHLPLTANDSPATSITPRTQLGMNHP